MFRRVQVAIALSSALAAPLAAQRPVVYRVPVTGMIEMGIAPFIRRAITEAEAAGASAVILDVNTLGGRVDAALQIVDAVTGSRIPVYAFVNPRAISAGALISVSTQGIYMRSDATIGASTVVDGQGTKVSEKAQSVMRAEYRALAERRGRDPRIGEAMVDEEIEIPGVIEAGKLLTLTTAEAVEVGYGVAATDFDDVLSQLGLDGAEVIEVERNWAENVVGFLSNPIIAGMLLSIGFLGLMIEIKTPSFGLAGSVGIASLAAFFGSHLLIGLAGWEEVILLGVGMVALAIEVFVVPGFGVAGIIALVCIGAGVFLALLGNLPTWGDIARAMGVIAFAVMMIVAAVYTFVGRLPTSDRWRGIFLRAATNKDRGFVSAEVRGDLIGLEGVAATDLHPSGTGVFGTERLDVVSEAGFVAKGRPIRIVRSEGYRLVVLEFDA
ncbi:MAG TPA: NfeD family protein [Gemmatimonadales bacterium]